MHEPRLPLRGTHSPATAENDGTPSSPGTPDHTGPAGEINSDSAASFCSQPDVSATATNEIISAISPALLSVMSSALS